MKNIYGIFEDEKMIAEGTGINLAIQFEVSETTINHYAHTGNVFLEKYKIRIIRTVRHSPPTKQFEFNEFDYLYRHLREYGNTVLNHIPECLEELESIFHDTINIRRCEDVDDPFNYEPDTFDPKKFTRGRRTPFYILELKHGIPDI